MNKDRNIRNDQPPWQLQDHLTAIDVKLSRSAVKETTLRLLDTACGNGADLAQIAQSIDQQVRCNVETFGIEHRTEPAAQAARILDNLVQARFKDTQISNEAFSLVILRQLPPEYADDPEALIKRAAAYLAPAGLLLWFATAEMIQSAAPGLTRLRSSVEIHRAPPNRNREFFIVSVRQTDRRVYNSRHHLENPEQNAHWTRPEQAWRLHPQPAGELLFSARQLDLKAAARESRETDGDLNAGAWQPCRQSLWPREPAQLSPLLPMRQAHVGLLTSSGFLDNLVLQNDRRRILVKGRALKVRTLVKQNEKEEVWLDQLKTSIKLLDLTTGEVEDVATESPA